MIVSTCRAHGCNALTIGSYCVEHDVPVTRFFVRGRPFTTTTTGRHVTSGCIELSRRPAQKDERRVGVT